MRTPWCTANPDQTHNAWTARAAHEAMAPVVTNPAFLGADPHGTVVFDLLDKLVLLGCLPGPYGDRSGVGLRANGTPEIELFKPKVKLRLELELKLRN